MIMVFAHSFASIYILSKQSAMHNACSYNKHNHGWFYKYSSSICM